MLVAVESINQALEKVQREIAAYREPLAPEDQYQRQRRTERLVDLQKGLILHDLIDLSKTGMENPFSPLVCDPRIRAIPIGLHDFLYPRCLVETSLVHYTQGEHGLWYRYRGRNGEVVCIQGMRHRALSNARMAVTGDVSLLDALISRFDVGMTPCSYVFRSAPILLPPEGTSSDWQTIFVQVQSYLRDHIELQDGFLPWRYPEKFAKVFGFAKEGWWRE